MAPFDTMAAPNLPYTDASIALRPEAALLRATPISVKAACAKADHASI
jgi:hypothetical protein